MSIGNLKDQGNKGNNFPYQLRNLQLLGDIATSVTPGSGLATEATLQQVVTNTTGVSRTPGILEATGAGATPFPVYSLTIANVGGAAGVVNGVNIPAGVSISFDGGALNNTLNPLSYNATGTIFIITYIS